MSSGPGLRERKKAKTRRAIQEAAIRLSSEQGFDNTTVDQIAEAAEISPSTFFRYFPTKEDAVLMDDYDPLLISALSSVAEPTNPVRAIREAMAVAFTEVFERDRDQIHQRTRLMLTTPSLRARLTDGTLQTQSVLDDALAARGGRPSADFETQVLVAACVAAMVVVLSQWAAGDSSEDLPALLDRALALLDPAERRGGGSEPAQD